MFTLVAARVRAAQETSLKPSRWTDTYTGGVVQRRYLYPSFQHPQTHQASRIYKHTTSMSDNSRGGTIQLYTTGKADAATKTATLSLDGGETQLKFN
jgi:hypothetical protein